MQQQAEVQGSFPSPGGLSLFWQVIAGQTKPSRSLLWQSGCCMIHHFCCISTFIYTFSYDLMHGQILSTSVALSEDSLLLFQLFSVNFYWTVLQCHFMFYVLKIINKFSENWNEKQVCKWTADDFWQHDFPQTCKWAFLFLLLNSLATYFCHDCS